MRNERITHETSLDLLKEETVLSLEVEMEERLQAFKQRKEEEVAAQLERQRHEKVARPDQLPTSGERKRMKNTRLIILISYWSLKCNI